MEICQSCGATIESWERVSFGIIGGVTRSWVMCTHCTDVLGEMVLGYMGELPPEQGSPESLGDEGQSCETCRGYSPLLLGCTKRTQPGAEACRRHGFAWWESREPKEPDRTTAEVQELIEKMYHWGIVL